MKKPEDLIWFGAAFGGGLSNRDLCGFLTSGEMAIGIYSGDLKLDRKAAKDICSRKSRELWQWWTATAPLHCSEILEGRNNNKVCQRLGKLAVAKVESLIAIAPT